MNEKIKKTALETSAGTDEKQSLINSNNIITDEDDFCNSDDLFAEFREESNPNFIRTFTLGELFDKSYDIKQPIIKDLLYPGMYLFVGAPKIGKSFAMLQIAHHVSNGLDLWDKKVNQGKVVYLALEDREPRIVSRYYNMFGVPPNPDNIIISTLSNKAGHGLEGQLEYILARNQGVSLIIIDTLQMIRESSNNKMNYSSDYGIIVNFLLFLFVLFILGLFIKENGFTHNFLCLSIIGQGLNIFDLFIVDLLWWRNTKRVRLRKMPEKELYQNPKKHIEAFIRAFIMYLLIALIDGYILTLL